MNPELLIMHTQRLYVPEAISDQFVVVSKLNEDVWVERISFGCLKEIIFHSNTRKCKGSRVTIAISTQSTPLVFFVIHVGRSYTTRKLQSLTYFLTLSIHHYDATSILKLLTLLSQAIHSQYNIHLSSRDLEERGIRLFLVSTSPPQTETPGKVVVCNIGLQLYS